MLLYKFEKMENTASTPYFEDGDENIAGYFSDGSLLSFYPEIEENGVKYIDDFVTGRRYRYNDRTFRRYESVEATVIPLCKQGLAVYDTTTEQKKQISKVPRGSKLYLTLDFRTDKNKDIWAKVFVLDNSGGFSVSDGYIIYKNSRNNFANVAITGTKFTTVLTGGKIDESKIESAKQQNPIMFQTASIDLSSVEFTTTTNGKSVGTGNRLHYTAPLDIDGGRRWDYKTQISKRHPNIVQNSSKFPVLTGYNKTTGMYEYDYALNYSEAITDFTKLYERSNLNTRSIIANRIANMERYNRFKLAFPDDVLSRGYMHVFMTRPDLNIKDVMGNLLRHCREDPLMQFTEKRNPGLLDQLVLGNGTNHQFMMLTSNKVKGFSVADKGINSHSMGKSRSGYQVHYGRRRDSDVGQDMSITYRETHNFDILNVHQIWVDYIEKIFNGKWESSKTYINGRILDYAVSVYVIVTAEDFETILFWSKYYGVFPVNVPFSAISWGGENDLVSDVEPQITYRFAWKEDMNPITLAELNMNAFRDKVPTRALYQKTFNPTIASSGSTWVGAPFVEYVTYKKGDSDLTDGGNITPKLRFRPNVR